MCLKSKKPDLFFHLARDFELSDGSVIRDVYGQIKSGEKKVEYRPNSKYWRLRVNRILADRGMDDCLVDFPVEAHFDFAHPVIDWFVTGFPKGNLPHLEVEVHRIVIPRSEEDSIEFHLGRVEEVSS